jgi:5-methylcytosine-specific restriction enzyme A
MARTRLGQFDELIKQCTSCGISFDAQPHQRRYCDICQKERPRVNRQNWDRTPAGRASQKRSRESEAGILRNRRGQQRYRSTEKGRLNHLAKQLKRTRGEAGAGKLVAEMHRLRLPCKRCGEEYIEGHNVDHIVPIFKGGNGNQSNLQMLCNPCHREKTRIDLVKEIIR